MLITFWQNKFNALVHPDTSMIEVGHQNRLEVMVKNIVLQHNLPLATADHLDPLFKEMFLDIKIAKSCASGRTVLNEARSSRTHMSQAYCRSLHGASI